MPGSPPLQSPSFPCKKCDRPSCPNNQPAPQETDHLQGKRKRRASKLLDLECGCTLTVCWLCKYVGFTHRGRHYTAAEKRGRMDMGDSQSNTRPDQGTAEPHSPDIRGHNQTQPQRTEDAQPSQGMDPVLDWDEIEHCIDFWNTFQSRPIYKRLF